jgi:hypothetical protein
VLASLCSLLLSSFAVCLARPRVGPPQDDQCGGGGESTGDHEIAVGDRCRQERASGGGTSHSECSSAIRQRAHSRRTNGHITRRHSPTHSDVAAAGVRRTHREVEDCSAYTQTGLLDAFSSMRYSCSDRSVKSTETGNRCHPPTNFTMRHRGGREGHHSARGPTRTCSSDITQLICADHNLCTSTTQPRPCFLTHSTDRVCGPGLTVRTVDQYNV